MDTELHALCAVEARVAAHVWLCIHIYIYGVYTTLLLKPYIHVGVVKVHYLNDNNSSC